MKTTPQRRVGTRRRWFVSLVACALVVACGGGGGTAFQPGEVVDALPGGLWQGTVTVDGEPGALEVVAVSTDEGEFRGVDGAGGVYFARLNVSGSEISGSMRAFAPPGTTFTDGSTITTGRVSGTLAERERMSGTFTLDSDDSGEFELVYDALHERDSSLLLIAGMWRDLSDTVFTVQADGAIFAQDALGCVYNGTASVIDPDYDVYRGEVHVSQCAEFDGFYQGLGVLDDLVFAGDNDAMVLIMSNDALAVVLLLARI